MSPSTRSIPHLKGAECHPVIDCPKNLAPVVAMRPIELGRIVGLRESGWTYRRIAAKVLGTMIRLCVAAFSSGLWNIPTPVRQVLGRVVQTHVKIDAFCEQRWPPEQHPGKKSGHMLHLLCHLGALGTVCFQRDSDDMCLWPGYH